MSEVDRVMDVNREACFFVTIGSLLITEYPGMFNSALVISFLSLDSDRPNIWKLLPEFSKIEEISEILLWA